MTDESRPNGNGAGQGGQPEQNFKLEKIYLKDTSFESPRSPAVFSQQWQPEIALNLQTKVEQVAETAYEVVLTVTVEANAESQPIFLVELQQAGIFTVAGFDDEQRGQLLGGFAPGVLFPYAREAIGELVAKGGFPQLLLQPVNFDALYQQQRQQADLAAGGTAGTA
ncbi:MAG TPA: protein-export chaperone SecB [Gammaproteobacteria bacterium]|jgi:preprotein translocase subunit SecB|nr:protein-export chaperone SecB [Gammaproteobacteria bacterium]